MEHEINQYLAQQREMAGDQADNRRERGRDNWDRNQGRDRRRNRSRPSRFNDVDEEHTPQIPQRAKYEGEEEIGDYREDELFQNKTHDEQHGEGFDSRRQDDRFGDGYEDIKRYPRSEDRHHGRHDERYEERLGDRRGDRQDDRRSARRGDRHGDRMDNSDRYGEGRDRGSGKEKPSRTVMLKSLHSSVTDHDIRAVLQMFGAPIKDVRLVKHRDTGVSRGFAFVEFQFQPDAQRWMEENQGHIDLAGQDTQLVYSSNKDREEDWFCSQCGTHNFKRRDYCFKCSISKDDSERYSEIGDVASNVLILMGLDALTTEDTVTKILEYISSAKMTISIARDNLTHTSRGYCYVEMNTAETATHLMNILASMQPPFQVDAKPVSVHFCKQHAPFDSKPVNPAATDAKWPANGTQGAATSHPSDTSAAGTAYYQPATFDPLQASQDSAYQSYAVQHSESGLPGQADYQAQGNAVGSNALASAVVPRTRIIPANREQYKAAVAQEQVQAARQLQLQQQQMQQQLMVTAKLQEEAKKLAAETAAAEAAAKVATAAAAAAAAAEDDQEALAKKARQWSEEKKKRKEEELEEEKTAKEKDDGGVAVPTTTRKRRKRKQESSGDTATAIVPRFFKEGMKYSTPDVSTYKYDELSGFYYDSNTGLYYDASSQYYFNSATQKYMYWDAASSTYLPAPDVKPELEQLTPKTDPEPTDKEEKPKEKDKKDKNDKNKMAKKLAKDMARWAKSMNSSKANSSKRGGGGLEGSAMIIGAADAGFAMLMKKANPADTKAALQHVLQKQTSDPGTGSSKLVIVASYGGGSDSDPELEVHPASATTNPTAATNPSNTVDALTDWSKLICLLCKRQFPSKEILVKHQQFSELHKQNLESLKHDQHEFGEEEASDFDYQYRDRAKERRQKFGVDDPPPKKKFRPPKPSIPYEEPTKEGLKEDNIGNQMLQKMGWNKGSGLGKKQQGRTEIIEVQKRQAGAGLGIKGGTYDITATDTYRDAVKKVMRNRFEEME